MISADLLIKLLKCSFPVVVIVVAAIYAAVKISREKRNSDSNVFTDPGRPYGMRPPTEEEAVQIKKQLAPRARRKLIVISCVFIPLAVMPGGAAVSMYGSEDFATVMVIGFIALSMLLMYIVFMSLPLSEMRSLSKRLYSVSDCYFADVREEIRYNHKGIPAQVYHAVIRDQIDVSYEIDLPKDLRRATAGTSCLVIVYDSEEKVNRSRTGGRYIYRRDVFVPSGELNY